MNSFENDLKFKHKESGVISSIFQIHPYEIHDSIVRKRWIKQICFVIYSPFFTMPSAVLGELKLIEFKLTSSLKLFEF